MFWLLIVLVFVFVGCLISWFGVRLFSGWLVISRCWVDGWFGYRCCDFVSCCLLVGDWLWHLFGVFRVWLWFVGLGLL